MGEAKEKPETQTPSEMPSASQARLGLTPQQRRLTQTESKGRFATYQDYLVGNQGIFSLFAFELYNLLAAPLPGLIGIGLRAAALRLFLKSASSGVVVNKSVTIRQPHRISIGKGTVIDDFSLLDVRSSLDGSTDIGIEIGNRVLVGRNSIITTKGGNIKIGDGCNIGTNCRLATRSKIELANSVLIAAYSYIGCGNHKFDNPDIPLMEQGMDIRGGVKIGQNAWIGTRATVVDGVTIGQDAIVGAHSLVTEDVPARAIVAGTPAKILRYRD